MYYCSISSLFVVVYLHVLQYLSYIDGTWSIFYIFTFGRGPKPLADRDFSPAKHIPTTGHGARRRPVLKQWALHLVIVRWRAESNLWLFYHESYMLPFTIGVCWSASIWTLRNSSPSLNITHYLPTASNRWSRYHAAVHLHFRSSAHVCHNPEAGCTTFWAVL